MVARADAPGARTQMHQSCVLLQDFGERAQLDAQLSRYSGVGVGGPADLLVVVRRRDEFIATMQRVQSSGLPWRVFGGLTNVLLPDEGLRGVTVLNHARQVQFLDNGQVTADGGAIMVHMAREAVRRGLSGLTWAVGLPGTVGGAIVNNAGAWGGEISRTLTSAEIWSAAGTVQVVGPEWFDFRYRHSRLKATNTPDVVLTATFKLTPRDPEYVAKKAAEYITRRTHAQPPGKTLGSTFKNPPGDYAGRLIEAVGLKGHRVGGFVISDQHANFFMNTHNGTAADYKALMQLVQETVQVQFGVRLESEIEIVEELGMLVL